ncbi:IS66 family insertion sequence element accessory protein TnpB [Sporomusa aerivorans]|uniref:IS66 family insertion sequence element accessory protein TnpB n=1 Tax=Sporomusa aerivorans TaxID=204936 RepID=UPI00352AE31E
MGLLSIVGFGSNPILFCGADRIYIVCGYTDLRRGIDGLDSIIQRQFQLNPFTDGRRLCSWDRRHSFSADGG